MAADPRRPLPLTAPAVAAIVAAALVACAGGYLANHESAGLFSGSRGWPFAWSSWSDVVGPGGPPPPRWGLLAADLAVTLAAAWIAGVLAWRIAGRRLRD